MNDPDDASINEDADNEFPPPRRRVRPVVIAGIVVLVALIVASGIFVTTRFAGGSANQAPTPTLVPGSNLYYFQLTPSWGSIFIDGQKLSHLPTTSDSPPLELSSGVHEVTWQVDPFLPQRCTIIVPTILYETKCLANDPVPVNVGPNKGLSAYVITFGLSLANLTNARRTALVQLVQGDLNILQSTETVQTGESFVNLQVNNFIAVAATTLHAHQHFLLDTNPDSNASCSSSGANFQYIGCQVAGENCHLFCSNLIGFPSFGADTPTLSNYWVIAVPISLTWDYTTLVGQVVAQNQPDMPTTIQTEYLIQLSIQWDAQHWIIQKNSHGTPVDFLEGDPACTPALSYVNARFAFTLASPPGNPNSSIFWNARAGPDASAGCVLSGTPSRSPDNLTPQPTVIALCLYRFGVLLALNDIAHQTWPDLPVADAYEQGIAQRIGTPT